MATTIPGGFYLGANGRFHDAGGNDLGAPLAEDTDEREALRGAGIFTTAHLEEAGVEGLTEIKGIGEKTAKSILKANGLDVPDDADSEEE